MVLLERRGDNRPLRPSGVHVGALPASPQVLSGVRSEQLGWYLAAAADPHRAAARVGVLRLGVDAEATVDERLLPPARAVHLADRRVFLAQVERLVGTRGEDHLDRLRLHAVQLRERGIERAAGVVEGAEQVAAALEAHGVDAGGDGK